MGPLWTPPPTGSAWLYFLRDPRDGRLRYVGKTGQALGYRLARHMEDSGTRSHRGRWLALVGRPVIEPFVLVPLADASFFERRAIAILRMRGYDLINGSDGGDGNTRPRSTFRRPCGKCGVELVSVGQSVRARCCRECVRMVRSAATRRAKLKPLPNEPEIANRYLTGASVLSLARGANVDRCRIERIIRDAGI